MKRSVTFERVTGILIQECQKIAFALLAIKLCLALFRSSFLSNFKGHQNIEF